MVVSSAPFNTPQKMAQTWWTPKRPILKKKTSLFQMDKNLGNFRGEVLKPCSSWWQLKDLLCSPGSLAEMIPNLTSIFFRWVGWNHQLSLPCFGFLTKKPLEPNLETPKVRSWSHWWDESHSGEGTSGGLYHNFHLGKDSTWKPGCGMPKPGNTVDGSEIWITSCGNGSGNPIIHRVFFTSKRWWVGFLPSTVVGT